MSKLDISGRLPAPTGNLEEDFDRLVSVVTQRFRDIASQVNAISEGRAAGHYNAQSAQPTGGYFKAGDFVRNNSPSEQGTTSGKYVVTGWLITVDGTASAASSVECRALTGN